MAARRRNQQREQEQQEPLPPLEPLTLPAEDYDLRGPTNWTNWLVPGRILVGAYPKHKADLLKILEAGITSFVNLIDPKELQRLEPNGPYIEWAKNLLNEIHAGKTPSVKSYTLTPEDIAALKRIRATNLQLIHFPILNCNIESDEKTNALVDNLIKRLNAGERLFIHCRGGHGRTGTIAAILVGRLFNLSAYEALEFVQRAHDCRTDQREAEEKYSSPETAIQRNQVYRLLLPQ